jgi:hypothetical protein
MRSLELEHDAGCKKFVEESLEEGPVQSRDEMREWKWKLCCEGKGGSRSHSWCPYYYY